MNVLVCAACGRPATDDMICECGEVGNYVSTAEREASGAGAPPEGAPPEQAPSEETRADAGPRPDPSARPRSEPLRHFECVFTESGRRVALAPGTHSVLGRDPAMSEAASFLEEDEFVSRRHATIGIDADGLPWIRDEYSTNGTFVNNERLPAGASRSLRHNDRVRIGEMYLRILRTAPPRQEKDHDKVT